MVEPSDTTGRHRLAPQRSSLGHSAPATQRPLQLSWHEIELSDVLQEPKRNRPRGVKRLVEARGFESRGNPIRKIGLRGPDHAGQLATVGGLGGDPHVW